MYFNLAFLGACLLLPQEQGSVEHIQTLVRGLASEDLQERENATDRLVGLGPSVVEHIKGQLNVDDKEVAGRISQILKDIGPLPKTIKPTPQDLVLHVRKNGSIWNGCMPVIAKDDLKKIEGLASLLLKRSKKAKSYKLFVKVDPMFQEIEK